MFILVFGSILPSLITIGSNLISVFRVQELNRVTSAYILPCRRRTDDTRRILLVITVECLFAIVNSWFSDILLALIYCKRNLSAGDDCPQYLKQNYDLLVLFDLFNSVSNIVLHCLCGRRFRNELRRTFKSFFKYLKHVVRNLWCCYCRIHCPHSSQAEHCVTYNATVTQRDSSNSSNNLNQPRVHLKIKPMSKAPRRHCCDCQWFINPRPLTHSHRCLSTMSKECLQKNRTPQAGQYQSLTQPSYVTRLTPAHSMKLYHPPSQTLSSSVNKNQCVYRR